VAGTLSGAVRGHYNTEEVEDMLSITFEVPGIPVAQPRHRHATSKSGKHVTYIRGDDSVVAFKEHVRIAARQAMAGKEVATGPIAVYLLFRLPAPKKYAGDISGNNHPHQWKPDLDNLEKAVLDSCKGVVFKDDCQICDNYSRKRCSTSLTAPKLEVSFHEVSFHEVCSCCENTVPETFTVVTFDPPHFPRSVRLG
jgi:Holliday junction resolvase RusA-like endonuclease